MSNTAAAKSAESLLERDLPSGRRLVIRSADGAETIEVQSPQRHVEVSILLTEDGPVIRASAQRLEMDAAEDVSVDCKRFEVRAQEMDVLATGPIRLDGEFLYLNCDDEARGEAGEDAQDG